MEEDIIASLNVMEEDIIASLWFVWNFVTVNPMTL